MLLGIYNLHQCYHGCITLPMLLGVYNLYQYYQGCIINIINIIRGIQPLSMLLGCTTTFIDVTRVVQLL